MTKKQVLVILEILQAALVGLLFLPVASDGPAPGGASMNAVDLARGYAATGRTVDAGVYLFFALGCPVVAFLTVFVLRNRRTAVGLTACLSAMDLLVHACFYTAVKSSFTVGGGYICLIVLSLLAMLLCVYAYLCVELMPGK